MSDPADIVARPSENCDHAASQSTYTAYSGAWDVICADCGARTKLPVRELVGAVGPVYVDLDLPPVKR